MFTVSASAFLVWFFLRCVSSSRFLAGMFGREHMFVFVGAFSSFRFYELLIHLGSVAA